MNVKNLIFRFIFLLCSCMHLFFNENLTVFVISSLSVFALVLASELYENKIFNLIVFLAVTVASIIIPQCIIFLPVLMYSLYYTDKQIYFLVVLLPFIRNSAQYSNLTVFVFIIMCGVGLLVKYQIDKDDRLIKMYKSQRDNIEESRRELELKIHGLVSRQDAEIIIARLNERNRISHEIHDNVGHLLSSSILQLAAIMAVTKEKQTKDSLLVVKETLDKGMNSIRASIHNMHETSLDFNSSLTQMINEFTFCNITLDNNITSSMPIKLRYSFISIIKEALTNVMKHSDADYVNVILNEHPSIFQLIIRDNGHVQNSKTVYGMGIEGIRQRVESFGGIINISTDNGFKIFISVSKENLEDEDCSC